MPMLDLGAVLVARREHKDTVRGRELKRLLKQRMRYHQMTDSERADYDRVVESEVSSLQRELPA